MKKALIHLHERAVELAQTFTKFQGELLEVLQQIDEVRGFEEFGVTSLHRYAVEKLGLSDDVAYTLCKVARKSRTVPELKEKIQKREINISQARVIVSILTPQNQGEWLDKATTLSKRELEREVFAQFPKEEVKERIKPVNASRLELRIGISQDLEERLRRIQDLLSQKQQKAVSLEEAVDALAAEFLERNDPVQMAERAAARKNENKAPALRPNPAIVSTASHLVPVPNAGSKQSRVPIPAALKHQVALRDQTQCTHQDPVTQKRCSDRRWLEMHHVTPVAQGGKNELNNLATLCSAHH